MNSKKFIPVAQPDLKGNEEEYLKSCLASSWISSKGEFIDKFEDSFARFVSTKFAITASNGTTALHLALVAFGIGKGDEVIVPDLTFIATANAVTYTGAKPVMVDVETETWNINSEKIEKTINERTKAIIVVHLYGHPADMNSIRALAQKYNLLIIEDAAEAHGAEIRIQNVWRKVGGLGNAGCFSFYGNKIITTGEGGMVVTNNKNMAERMKILRDHGQKPNKRYYHELIGFNYRMTNMQAAIGLAQLERIDRFIKRKRLIAELYNQYLKNIPGITLPPQTLWAKSVYWMYSILIEKPYSCTRDHLIDVLQKNNIESRPFFYPLHVLPPYKTKGDFKNSEYLSKHGLNLPSSVALTKSDIKRITLIIRSV